MKIICIQPKEQDGGTLPYPYFIDKEGLVGRQDFWKGKPYKLIGFTDNPKPGYMKILFSDFWENPKEAIGLYTVFSDKEDNWFTQTIPIESVEEEKKK